MFDNLKRMGWDETNILLIDADAGVSGTLKIDERKGMSEVFELITSDQIGAVAAQDEDRLFRDVTMIQVNIFIEACRAHSVSVITPYFAYEFHHPTHGRFHAQQFRMRCEMAAEYINTVVIGKLAGARKYLMRQGLWAGAPIPIGFMADMRQHIESGRNPNYRKFVPFEPYAEMIRLYFRLFLDVGGVLNETVRRIMKDGLFYPDPDACKPPDGFSIHYTLKRQKLGYHPTRSSLMSMFTNPAYIGHWVHKSVVVQRNNHAPIVDEATFWQAFNHLSTVDLNGNPNPHHRPIRPYRRPTLESQRPAEAPLCAGLLYGELGGESVRMSTVYVHDLKTYTYEMRQQDPIRQKRNWTRRCFQIDEAVEWHVKDKLHSTFNPRAWEVATKQLQISKGKEKAFKQNQIKAIESAIENLIASFENTSNPSLIRSLEARYEGMVQTRDRYLDELADIEKIEAQRSELIALRDQFEHHLNGWEGKGRDEKRNIIHMLIRRIDLRNAARYQIATFTITWFDNSTDVMLIVPLNRTGTRWRYDEVQTLYKLIKKGAQYSEWKAALPQRTHRSITNLARRIMGTLDVCSSTQIKSTPLETTPLNLIELILKIPK